MKLTRRGWVVLGVVLTSVVVVALVFAWETGQAKQCHWFRDHGTQQQVAAYCGPGGG